MRKGFIGLAVAGTIAVTTSGVAMAQTCPPGQIMQAGMCRPAAMTGTTGTYAAPGTVASPSARAATTTTTTTTRAPAATAPVPAMGSSMPQAESTKTCPTGFTLYNNGCYPAQDAANAMMH